MKLWILSASCGDYYCGCCNNGLTDASHVIGVYTSAQSAETAKAAAEKAEYSFRGQTKRWRSWEYETVLNEVESDVIPAGFEQRS